MLSTYNDLPCFVPESEEYRITVMIRNPYNRFYSAVKEFLLRLKNVGGVLKYPELMAEEYAESNLLTKIYLLSICPVNDICNQIFRCSDQNFYLRNKRIPWLNPQSYFLGKNVEVFQYESENDWLKLLELFDLSEYQNRLSIARDYNIPEEVREMIEKLYPEDRKLFRMY